MDKIIFGDNQFFGVNHMSEQKAISQSQRFKTSDDIFKVLEYVNEIGIKSFMFTTHDKLEPVLKKISLDPRFADFKLMPCMPYAHKYANAMAEKGALETINKFVPGNKIVSGMKGLNSALMANPVPIIPARKVFLFFMGFSSTKLSFSRDSRGNRDPTRPSRR